MLPYVVLSVEGGLQGTLRPKFGSWPVSVMPHCWPQPVTRPGQETGYTSQVEKW